MAFSSVAFGQATLTLKCCSPSFPKIAPSLSATCAFSTKSRESSWCVMPKALKSNQGREVASCLKVLISGIFS